VFFHIAFENCLAHVESAHGISLDHSFETIDAQFFSTGKEIASCTID